VPATLHANIALLICLLLACRSAQAAGPVVATAPNLPTAGSMLQQAQPGAPVGAAPSGVRLTVQEQPGAPVPPGIAFRVTTIVITGNTSIATAQLHALVRDAEGQDLTLAAIGELLARITDCYQRQGFPLARAIVPGQTLVAGVLQVQVIEARYGAVVLVNRTTLRDALLHSALTGIQSGQVVQQAPLDHALLSLSDIPGVLVQATMKPGSRAGDTDLELIATTSSDGVAGSSVVDNHGNRYAGRTRLGQSLRWIDPLKQQAGATLDFNGLSSGKGLNYGRVAYETVLSGAATRVGGAFSVLQYALGGPLTASESYGDARVAQVWVRRSLLRSHMNNLQAQVQYDNTRLRDRSGFDIDNQRHTDKVAASLTGEVRDGLWFGAVNNWSLSLLSGVVIFDNAAAQQADAGHAAGRFTKVGGNFSRLQKLNSIDSLYVALSLQWANRKLDPSEKIAIGGPGSLRAADTGALSGDLGAMLNLEYRHSLGAASGGHWQLTVFMDSATVQPNKTALGPDENQLQLSGAGVGLAWSGPKQIFAKAQLAKLLGTASPAGATASWRAWVEIAQAF